jgi:hypothetical protein
MHYGHGGWPCSQGTLTRIRTNFDGSQVYWCSTCQHEVTMHFYVSTISTTISESRQESILSDQEERGEKDGHSPTS